MQRIGPKTPYERRPVTIDFKRYLDLTGGEEITDDFTISAEVYKGIDSDPQSLIEAGVTIIAPSIVKFWIKDGSAGVDYEIAVQGATNQNTKIESRIRLFVTDDI